MKVRVLIAFGFYRAGDLIPEMPSAQADDLRMRGFVEEVAEDIGSLAGKTKERRGYATREMQSLV